MIDAQQVEHGGVEVVHVHGVFDGVVAQLVGSAEGHAGPHAAAGHEQGVSADVVVAPAVALHHGRAAELAAPNDQGVVEHAALLQVGNKGGRRLIDQLRRRFRPLLHLAVVVPAAMVQLDEPDAAFGQAAGQQAVRGERAVAPLGAVHFLDVVGFLRIVGQLRHAHLHSERQFVLGNSRGDVGIVDRRVERLVQLAHHAHHFRLALGRHAGRILGVQHRVSGRAKLRALEPARQQAAGPLAAGDGLRLPAPFGSKHDEAGQVVRLGAQTVQHPRPHAGPARDECARVHEQVGRIMVDLLGVHRPDDAEVVGHSAEVREDRGDFLAAPAPPLERMLRPEAAERLALQLSDRLALGERRGHSLTVQLLQLRLVVEGFVMRRAARHVQLDNPLRPRHVVQRIDDAPPVRFAGRLGARPARVRRQQRRQRRGADPLQAGAEKVPPGLPQQRFPPRFVHNAISLLSSGRTVPAR